MGETRVDKRLLYINRVAVLYNADIGFTALKSHGRAVLKVIAELVADAGARPGDVNALTAAEELPAACVCESYGEAPFAVKHALLGEKNKQVRGGDLSIVAGVYVFGPVLPGTIEPRIRVVYEFSGFVARTQPYPFGLRTARRLRPIRLHLVK